MKYLFDLSHPAHFHLFKQLAKKLLHRGDQVVFAAKQKDVLLDLLKADPDFSDKVFIKSEKEKAKGLKADLQWLVMNDLKMVKFCLQHRPDMVLTTTFSGIHAGWWLRIPRFYFAEDDFRYIHKVIQLVYPFTSALLCPVACEPGHWTDKTAQYHSYHELAYLHPSVFQADETVRDLLKPPYLILRLADLRAHHDLGKQGMTDALVQTLIQRYGQKYRIYLSAERSLPAALESYRFPLAPERMHSALQYAEMVIGDSATLMMEAGALGVPAVYTGYFVGERGVLNELEKKYQLIFGIPHYDHASMLQKIEELMNMPNRNAVWQQRREQMLRENYDPSDFFLWFIDHYPSSLQTMKTDPQYDLRFLTACE